MKEPSTVSVFTLVRTSVFLFNVCFSGCPSQILSLIVPVSVGERVPLGVDWSLHSSAHSVRHCVFWASAEPQVPQGPASALHLQPCEYRAVENTRQILKRKALLCTDMYSDASERKHFSENTFPQSHVFPGAPSRAQRQVVPGGSWERVSGCESDWTGGGAGQRRVEESGIVSPCNHRR